MRKTRLTGVDRWVRETTLVKARTALKVAVLAVFTAFFAVGAALAQPIPPTVKMPNKVAKPGQTIYVAVNIKQVTNVGNTIDLIFTYDPAVLTARKVYRTRLTTTDQLSYGIDPSGMVAMTLYGTIPEGDILWVSFDALGGVGASSALHWTYTVADGGLGCNRTDGSVSIVTPQTEISAPEVVGDPGANVPVLIHAGPFTGGDSFDIDIEFDPGVVTATSVQKTSLTQPLSLTTNTAVTGLIRVALFGTQSINGPGNLLTVTFHVAGPLGSETPIEITRANINEGAIPTTRIPGLFTICDTTDSDGDTFTGCAGDCNDSNGTVYPGAADTGCDGVDQDCDGSVDEGYVSQPTSCGIGHCAATGATTCVGGVLQDSCTPGTPQGEICNGIDDDCNGVTDDAVVPQELIDDLAVGPVGPTPAVHWSQIYGADTYDVVRGRLSVLASSGGNFTLATQLCLANDTASMSVGAAGASVPGDGYWYLVRGSNCGGPGTYDSGTGSQVGLRDAEIQASPSHCP